MNDVQSLRLLKANKTGVLDTEVMLDGTLNNSKGVMWRDLLNCTKEEIDDELHVQAVLMIRYSTKQKLFPPSCTFYKLKCLDKTKAGFHRLIKGFQILLS